MIAIERNRMPKTPDHYLSLFTAAEAARARAFHESFPPVSYTHLEKRLELLLRACYTRMRGDDMKRITAQQFSCCRAHASACCRSSGSSRLDSMHSLRTVSETCCAVILSLIHI